MEHRKQIAIRGRVKDLGAMTTAQRKTVLVRKGFRVSRVAFLSEEDVLLEILKAEFHMKDIRKWQGAR